MPVVSGSRVSTFLGTFALLCLSSKTLYISTSLSRHGSVLLSKALRRVLKRTLCDAEIKFLTCLWSSRPLRYRTHQSDQHSITTAVLGNAIQINSPLRKFAMTMFDHAFWFLFLFHLFLDEASKAICRGDIFNYRCRNPHVTIVRSSPILTNACTTVRSIPPQLKVLAYL
jgi:hypothetical protein